jgi:hypothetical protein
LHTTAGAFGLQTFALEESGNNVRLTNGSAQVEQASKERGETIRLGEDEIVAEFNLIQEPLIAKSLLIDRFDAED